MSLYEEYVAVLSVLNLVSDFLKCNHPIGQIKLPAKSRLPCPDGCIESIPSAASVRCTQRRQRTCAPSARASARPGARFTNCLTLFFN
jgi:hypothetical protein